MKVKGLKFSLFVCFSIVMLSAYFIILGTSKVDAVSASEFDAGNIISDAVFFNDDSMSEAQIQKFLDSKMPECNTNHSESTYWKDFGRPYICLKNYREDPTIAIKDCTDEEIQNHFGFGSSDSRYEAAKNYCWWKRGRTNLVGGTPGSNSKSAARIIWEAAQEYRINPQVLLVTLQKEQSLITDDYPWVGQYQKAMGYACPDTAACDPQYRGFYNQVRNAARQFRRYVSYPEQYNHAIGDNYVRYHPTSSCGGSMTKIRSAGTAALYNYTPYQPNQASLSAYPGSGDDCSSYGNRNFWFRFNDWFGSTTVSVPYRWAMASTRAYEDQTKSRIYNNIKPISMAPSSSVYVQIRLKNTGGSIWNKDSAKIGTISPHDRTSIFYDASWSSTVRPTTMTEEVIYPGEIGTFEFKITAPAEAGSYKEEFGFVAERLGWAKETLTLDIQVISKAQAQETKHILNSGEALKGKESLISTDAHSVLRVQGNGKLVIYKDFEQVWTSQTGGKKTNRLAMQTDGNLVLYGENNEPLWHSNTHGYQGAYLKLQTDGNLVLYSESNQPLWWSNTSYFPDGLSYSVQTTSSSVVFAGQTLEDPTREYKLRMQGDGNLVLYDNATPLWWSNTSGYQNAYLKMQGDGNLVIYSQEGKPLWHTNTHGYKNAKLRMQDDRNIVIYDALSNPVWHTKTRK